MSATNYSRADASSRIGGGGTALTPPAPPGKFDTPSVPSPFGGGVAEPFLWSMVQMLVGDVWPNGDPAQLRAPAGGWQTFASTPSVISGQLAGPSATISGQQIPEGGAMTSAISDLQQGLSYIASESGKLATQVLEFAADVEAAQNAIRDLLSRLSPAGIFDGLQALLSGDALEELKEIADDIRTVLDNLKRQAAARQQALQDVTQMLDDAVVSLEQKARKEFTHYLGDDVGNATATAFDFQLNPLRFAYDFEGAKETWGGMLETNFNASLEGQIIDPERAAETQKEMLKGLVHTEDWTTERPGLGLGQNVFDVGSALLGGAGAARTGTRATGSAADAADEAGPGVRAAGVVDNAVTDTSSIAGRAGGIADNLDDLADDIPTTAPANPRGLTIPPSLVEPQTSRVSEAPGVRVADSTVDRAPAAPAASDPGDSAPRTPTATPPIGGSPEPRVPTVDVPSGSHQTAPGPTGSSAPTAAAPPPAVTSHTPAARPSGQSPSTSAGTSTHAPAETPHQSSIPPSQADGIPADGANPPGDGDKSLAPPAGTPPGMTSRRHTPSSWGPTRR